MRQFYRAKIKAVIEGTTTLRADSKREVIRRVKENLKDSLKNVDLKARNIKVTDIQGEFD